MYIRHLDTLCILFKEFRQRSALWKEEDEEQQQKDPCVELIYFTACCLSSFMLSLHFYYSAVYISKEVRIAGCQSALKFAHVF